LTVPYDLHLAKLDKTVHQLPVSNQTKSKVALILARSKFNMIIHKHQSASININDLKQHIACVKQEFGDDDPEFISSLAILFSWLAKSEMDRESKFKIASEYTSIEKLKEWKSRHNKLDDNSVYFVACMLGSFSPVNSSTNNLATEWILVEGSAKEKSTLLFNKAIGKINSFIPRSPPAFRVIMNQLNCSSNASSCAHPSKEDKLDIWETLHCS